MNSRKAWYIGCSAEQVAKRVILLGDPGRVPRFSQYLSDVQAMPVNRGLATVTGMYGDTRITLSAFGMGSPIAAIVLHELANLGASVFLRIGTSIGLSPVNIGDMIIARNAKSFEGTSSAYAHGAGNSSADPGLVSALTRAASRREATHHVGAFASFDGFYQDMFALDEATEDRVRSNLERLAGQDVLAVDMETSAILTVGKALGCKAGSMCASTVNSLKKQKIGKQEHADAERTLISIALEALKQVDPA
ncbi:MAG: nucleoside phosphorylase [Rhodospirillaceae bacterium]|nr:nucleoside phosphorylase [Rhodospirillaceae bacterium]